MTREPAHEPVEAVVDAGAIQADRALDVPPLLHLVQPQPRREVGGRERLGLVLLVGEYEHRGVREVSRAVQQLDQLRPHVNEAGWVTRVDHKHQAVGRSAVLAPQLADLLLPTHVENR